MLDIIVAEHCWGCVPVHLMIAPQLQGQHSAVAAVIAAASCCQEHTQQPSGALPQALLPLAVQGRILDLSVPALAAVGQPKPAEHHKGPLGTDQQRLVQQADLLFISSCTVERDLAAKPQTHGADVSNRGLPPGGMQVSRQC